MRRTWALSCLLLLPVLAACVGKRCQRDADCASIESGYCTKVGTCTRLCGAQAVSDAPLSGLPNPGCPAGSACVREGRRLVCLQTCSTDAQCSAGWECRQVGEARVCEFSNALASVPPH